MLTKLACTEGQLSAKKAAGHFEIIAGFVNVVMELEARKYSLGSPNFTRTCRWLCWYGYCDGLHNTTSHIEANNSSQDELTITVGVVK
jgi:hypothetical protein